MPKASQAFTLPVPPDVAIDLARRLCLQRGWPIERLGDHELAAAILFKTRRASVVLALTPAVDETSVLMDGHISGVGLVLKRMLQEKLDAFRAALIYEAGRTLPARREA